MDSYTPLLEKTRAPQPSLQKFAVTSIFSKLRTAPDRLGPESQPGREAITHCLTSNSSAVVDQSVRELCRLVSDSKLDLSRGLLELQSALEGTDRKFVSLFIKGLGFLTRIGFERKNGVWNFNSSENHPFVKILSCRAEVQSELVQQVLHFIMCNRDLGMPEVCEFLKPFINYSIFRVSFAGPAAHLFLRQLISSVASLCCSLSCEAIPIIRLLTTSLKYVPRNKFDEFGNFYHIVEFVVDAYAVVLRHLARSGLPPTDAQQCGQELVDTVLSLCMSSDAGRVGKEPVLELLKHVLAVQRDHKLPYVPELSTVVLSLIVILVKSELEHEQLATLKFLNFLLKWKYEEESHSREDTEKLSEELLLIFPIINLLSSPSKTMKEVASDLLSILQGPIPKLFKSPSVKQFPEENNLSLSTPGSVVSRFLHRMWSQDRGLFSRSLFLNLASSAGDKIEMPQCPRSWASQLGEYSQRILARRKSSDSISQSLEISLLLGAVAGVSVMHPSFGSGAIDSVIAIGALDPRLGVPLLLAVLFYSNLLTAEDVEYQTLLPKLLGILPSLVSQSMMIPLVVQTLMPMLRKDMDPVLYATATRLLCQTWEINDRVFGTLQGVLDPKELTYFKSERQICISQAASIRDVCRKNPDRGVDLILSVQACIENQDFVIKALGFQSLAHLCEADVIDFYTAWDVVVKHVPSFKLDPIFAHSVCVLLKWGAMDAEAYPEASMDVLKLLWEVGKYVADGSQWVSARISALEALAQYDVSYMERACPGFKEDTKSLLFSETNMDILKAMQSLLIKIMMHEHSFRRRYLKEKKVPASKIEKLLDVFPRIILSSGTSAGDLPGAALLCASYAPKNISSHGGSKEHQGFHAIYETAFKEAVASLQLSRNTIIALASMQSFKSFVRRWLRGIILSYNVKGEDITSDKTSRAANDILKSMMQIAEKSIPRSAENTALALGALCAVLPESAHAIKSTASKFLLSWLFQHEHEHRQWTAALSLGWISSSLHVTDHKQKLENISGLLEVLRCSKSNLVKGACGVGLGLSCQDLLTRTETIQNFSMNDETYRTQEERLVGRIVRTLSLMLSLLSPSSSNILESLSLWFPMGTKSVDTNISLPSDENSQQLDEDEWGTAGLVIGLGMSVGAVYRAGASEVVLKIKDLMISWMPLADSMTQNYDSHYESSKIAVSAGSSLALPFVIAFCQSVELLDGEEAYRLIKGYSDFISELLSVNKSGASHNSLLMASCVGGGSLLGCLLNKGIHSVEVESVKCMLELFRKCYTSPHPPAVRLGALLGVVNALGAGVENLVHSHPLPSLKHPGYEEKENVYIVGPLLSSSSFAETLTSLLQEIFLIAQNSSEHHLQHNAAWSISFLRNYLWSKEVPDLDNCTQADTHRAKPASSSVSEDSMVMKLALWLMSLESSGVDDALNVNAVESVLKSLSHAPRLPALEWGAIIRRCMRFESQSDALSPPGKILKNGSLREQCLQFSLAHASQFDGLLTFLDELSEFSRFNKLELNLQSCLLLHLVDMVRIFSGSRVEKLFDDAACYLTSLPSNQVYSSNQKSELRTACWKGLLQCLEDASLTLQEYISKVESCMVILFAFLPESEFVSSICEDQVSFVNEWSAAVRCLGKSRRDWLLDFLKVSHLDTASGSIQHTQKLKKIQARAKLARAGLVPVTDLRGLKPIIFNCESSGIWDVLIEVTAALQKVEASVKKQWLVDAMEMSCISSHPSTAILFAALLAGSCCKYMPLLITDQISVLKDLHIIITSLISDPNWEAVAQPFVSYLWVSLERVYRWANQDQCDNEVSMQPIAESERCKASFLVRAMHQICVSFMEYLPLEKQIGLASMAVF